MKAVVVVLFALLLLCGCTSFGTFASLEQGETTKEQVRSMLGEPENRLFETGGEVWKYQFVKEGQKKADRQQTVIDLSIIFKDDVVDNYEVVASKRDIPRRDERDGREERPTQQQSERPARQSPRQQGQDQAPGRSEDGFIKNFDKDGDGRVSRKEFPGPDRAFNQLDKNNDGYVDESENPPPRPEPDRRREQGRMQR